MVVSSADKPPRIANLAAVVSTTPSGLSSSACQLRKALDVVINHMAISLMLVKAMLSATGQKIGHGLQRMLALLLLTRQLMKSQPATTTKDVSAI